MPRSKRLAEADPAEFVILTVPAGGTARYTGEVEQHFPFLPVLVEGEERVGVILKPGDVVTVTEAVSHVLLQPVKE